MYGCTEALCVCVYVCRYVNICKQSEAWTVRKTDGQTGRQADKRRRSNKQSRQTDRQTDETDRQADTETQSERQTDRQAASQQASQAGRQAETLTHLQTLHTYVCTCKQTYNICRHAYAHIHT